MLLMMKRHAETSSVPIFLYRMSIETSLNMMKNIFGIEEPGVYTNLLFILFPLGKQQKTRTE